MFGKLGYVPLEWPVDTRTEESPTDTAQQQMAGRPVLGASKPSLDSHQFTLFQLTSEGVRDIHAAAAALKGSDEKPDIQVRIELVSFQIPCQDGIGDNMKATLRLDVGQDRSSQSDRDPLFWSIAAGLDLASQALASSDPKERSANLSQPFKDRPIEIPGGLAEMRIELIAHQEPAWWRRIFSLTDNVAVRKLVSAVGFPGIALDAVKLLDEIIGRFEAARAVPIFQSRPLTLALNERAATDFSSGIDSVVPAVLNNGLFLMLRHCDVDVLRTEPPVYMGGYRRLAPKKNWDGKILKVSQNDPYCDLNYVIIRVKTRETRIESRF